MTSSDPFDIDSSWHQREDGKEVDHRKYKYNKLRCMIAEDGRKQRSCTYYVRNCATKKCLFLMKKNECIAENYEI